MAGGQERILRERIRSIQATKKITRAMELIAASRIVKAQARVAAAVPYSEQITEVVKDLAAERCVERLAVARRPRARSRRRATSPSRPTVACAAATTPASSVPPRARSRPTCSPAATTRSSRSAARPRATSASAATTSARPFNGFSDQPHYDDARAIGEHVVELYTSGEVDTVELVYTRFISAGTQEVVLRPLVPLRRETVTGGDGKAPAAPTVPAATTSSNPTRPPSSTRSLPRYIEARIYAALLNAAASEHAFRQRAMKAATDNAEELIKSLSRIMNRARQDSITTEIMEIVSGAEALDSDTTDLPYIELGDLYASATPGA